MKDEIIYVNKKMALPNNYIPKDLRIINVVTEDNRDIKLVEKVAKAVEQIVDDAKKLHGYEFVVTSGYRSYDYQKKLLDRYILELGETRAKRGCAIPGYSEHQTGLAADITIDVDGELIEVELANTQEGIWLANNVHKYGFVIRYPKNKENITGYMYEPWHIRYLGENLATYLYENELTLDEYINEKAESN